MLSIGKMLIGQEAYYDNLQSEDYYLDGGEPPGKWFGRGAEDLGLTGQVESHDFGDVFKGRLRGKKLVQDSAIPRSPGWDLTFSAPKSVSVIFSQADYEESKGVREAQQAAVEKALAYVEENCGFTRRGKGGTVVEKARCIFSTFEHGTSRAEQPQLHTHALMINLCVREDGTTGALKTEKLYQHKMAAGAVYRAELAYQLEQRLGLETIRDGFSFKVVGVKEELCDHFSKRRQEIEEKLAELGLDGARASSAVTLSTRATKGKISRQELVKEWRETGVSFGWSVDQLQDILGKARSQPEVILKNQADLAAIESVEKLMEQRSFFTEKDAVRFTCEFSQGRGVGADLALEATQEALRGDHLVSLGIHNGEKHYTTQAHLDLEAQLMKDVSVLKEGEGIQVDEETIQKALKGSADQGKPLTQEQEKATRHLLQGEGRISTIIGDAGTGKTTVLKPATEALENSGYRVQGIALAGKAAEGMQEGAGIESGTIASFLWAQNRIKNGWNEVQARQDFEKWVRDKRDELPPGEAAEFNPVWTKKIAQEAKARFEGFQGKHAIDEKTVLIMDEAGMTDTQQMAQVVEIVKDSGAKLVAIGDPKQIQAILQGGGFRGMAEEVQGARLTEIFRQKDEKEKTAVREMAGGSVREALNHYAEEGRLDISESRDRAKEQLIQDWSGNGVSRPEENLMLAGLNLDVFEMNQMAQEARKKAGYLGEDSIKVENLDLHFGDRVIFTRNQKSLGVKNGSCGTVRGFSNELGTVSVELDGAGESQYRTRTISLDSYDHLKLGYAVTAHKSQGMTVKNAFVLTDEMMTDRQMSYVQLSRVEDKARIYTTRDEAGEQLANLVRSMERDREKIMAIELARKQAEEEARRLAQKTL